MRSEDKDNEDEDALDDTFVYEDGTDEDEKSNGECFDKLLLAMQAVSELGRTFIYPSFFYHFFKNSFHLLSMSVHILVGE